MWSNLAEGRVCKPKTRVSDHRQRDWPRSGWSEGPMAPIEWPLATALPLRNTQLTARWAITIGRFRCDSCRQNGRSSGMVRAIHWRTS